MLPVCRNGFVSADISLHFQQRLLIFIRTPFCVCSTFLEYADAHACKHSGSIGDRKETSRVNVKESKVEKLTVTTLNNIFRHN